MAKYSVEFKQSIVNKMMPPHSQSVAELARETGLKEVTLYKWKNEAKTQGFVAPGEQNSERWSTKDKFQVVVETASLTAVELAEYCRSKGLFVEQVSAWKDACMYAS